MARYPDNYFDLAIVDPPYGIKWTGESVGQRKKWACSNKLSKHKKKDWDNETPNTEYFNELFRVSKNQIICGGNYFDLPPTRGIVCWDKKADGTFFSKFELIWTSFYKAANIFRLPIQDESQNKIHPTQKPIKLYKWLLKNYAKEGDKILDTHLGSGSIAIACHDYKYDLTACELDKEYFDKAMERITNHTNQTKLF
jgi:site-specific DNA-methyltransferase (adenine-specific)